MIAKSELNLDYAQSARLALPMVDRIGLVLVGCGGTGSWLAPGVVRVGRLLAEKFGKEVTITFFDPDVVEEKNVYRQNFCQAEIGRNKADVLAYRYGLAWGMEITAMEKAFEPGMWARSRVNILCGCVDNPMGRKAIRQALTQGDWWLDCGNTKSYGQVLLGAGGSRPEDPFALPGLCSWLPLPSERHPELVDVWEGAPQIEKPAESLSCADMAMLDSQGLAINLRVAAEATDYLVRMLLTKDLRKMSTYMDLESGSSRAVYITPANCKVAK